MEKLKSKRGYFNTAGYYGIHNLLFTSGYYNLVKKNYALSEIQSMLDVAGTAVLKR